jgi:hypothetical protein
MRPTTKTVYSTDAPSLLLCLLPSAMLLTLLESADATLADVAAPPAVKWVKGYTFGQSESHPHAGVECADGGFLVVGDGQDYANETVKRHIMVLKTDRAGNAQWQQTFGDLAWNYGKFGIELTDGSVLVAGAMSTAAQAGARGRAVLQRTLLHLDGRTGALLQRLSLPNPGWRDDLKDGFMSGLITQGVPGVPQDSLAPRPGPFGPPPDREGAIGNAPALAPGHLAPR